MSSSRVEFERPLAAELARRLREPRRFIQVVAGARQVGKTTLVRQVTRRLAAHTRFASADEPTLRGPDWIAQQWEAARSSAAADGTLLVLDEVQKAVGWAESVKRLWDEDTHRGRNVKVVLLGSAPLLVQQGLTESLAGRFEVLHAPHWSYTEMRDAFGFEVDDYVYYGGYPGAARRCRPAPRTSEVLGPNAPAAGLEPQAPGHEHGAHERAGHAIARRAAR